LPLDVCIFHPTFLHLSSDVCAEEDAMRTEATGHSDSLSIKIVLFDIASARLSAHQQHHSNVRATLLGHRRRMQEGSLSGNSPARTTPRSKLCVAN